MANLPTMDFETYSESGYRFDPHLGRFVPLLKGKPGIKGVNASTYAAHPSTRVLSLAYDLLDGRGTILWRPGDAMPQDLFQHIEDGGLVEAHNSIFEFYIWFFVCWQRMGWIPLPIFQLRCSAAKARAWGLPGALGKLSTALNPTEKKDKRGAQLISLLSIPKKPTKKCAALFRSREEYPELHLEMDAYNIQDVTAEKSISAMIPDLSAQEAELWALDQEINSRGVHINRAGLMACIDVFNQAQEKYTDELKLITGQAVQTVDELTKGSAGDKWLITQGVVMDSLDKQHVTDALKGGALPLAARRALEIRQELGAASVKKLFAMERTIGPDDRIRDLFLYCGAERTGRFAGRGPQPQNLKNSGPDCWTCAACGQTFNPQSSGVACPFCGALTGLAGLEWGNRAAKAALETITTTQNLLNVEAQWGPALEVITSCLRSLYTAAPGRTLICSDYSAIEAVVLAALAGEEWRLEVFRTHGKIYEMSAAKISGIPFEEILAHKAQTGKHHPLRKKVGKVAELACFTRSTQVLTKRGYVRIVDVLLTDLLWDGVEWVKHDGVVYKGKRGVINLDGVRVTPDHPVSMGGFWMRAKELVSNRNMRRLALAIGSGSLRSCGMKNAGSDAGPCAVVPVVRNVSSIFRTCIPGNRQGAAYAAGKKRLKRILKYILNTPISCQIQGTDGGLLTDLGRPFQGVTIKTQKDTPTTGGVASESQTNGGEKTGLGLFSNTLSRLKAGMSRLWKWIGGIRMPDTNPEISGLSPAGITCSIKGVCKSCSTESLNLRNVYDIANAGPQHRFLIKTNSGHLLVHNSGYGGWIGAWKNFGADKFMNDQEIKTNILKWRDESPTIVEFWGGQYRKDPDRWAFTPELYGLEGAAINALLHPGTWIACRSISYGFDTSTNVLYCRLPSGRCLSYHQPLLSRGTDPRGLDVIKISFMGNNSDASKGRVGWNRIETYSGKLAENVTQAVARDILTAAMVRVSKAGYPIVLHVHDEIIAEVPQGTGSIEEFERLMMVRESWFQDWPIKAAGGWMGNAFRK